MTQQTKAPIEFEIEITDEDILDGKKKLAASCPIATKTHEQILSSRRRDDETIPEPLYVCGMYGDLWVLVNKGEIVFREYSRFLNEKYKMSNQLRLWVHMFDNHHGPKPIIVVFTRDIANDIYTAHIKGETHGNASAIQP